MNRRFATHSAALDYAEAQANANGRDYGIEYSSYDSQWIVRGLPSESHSFGYDWTAERIRPFTHAGEAS